LLSVNYSRIANLAGEIGQVLKARVTDTNKIVQGLALDIVARISTGMGKAFDRHVRLFVLPVSTVLADQKASVRTSALQTLTAIGTACSGLETMASGIGSALETSNPVQKSTLLQWLVNWFKEHQASSNLDASSWIPSIISSLDDRSTDVRKGAQALLPTLIACAGFEHVMQQTNSLKPASRSSAVPLIQAARSAASQIVAQDEEEISRPVASAPESPPDSPTVSTVKASSKPVGVRRKLPQSTSRPDSRAEAPSDNGTAKLPSKGTGAPKRPSAAATQLSMQNQSTNFGIFHGMNQEAKKVRLNKDAQKWINESGPTRKDLAELLQSQMEPHCSKDLIAHLFSHDHNAINDYMAGLTMICDFYNHAVQGNSDAQATCLAVLDLPLKYVSIKAHEPQSNLTSKCLDVVEAILSFVRHVNYQLNDPEAQCFVPTMIYKVSVSYLLWFHANVTSLEMHGSKCEPGSHRLSRRFPWFTLIADFSNYYLTMG
jgi:cytoskeleton-associated protein 5